MSGATEAGMEHGESASSGRGSLRGLLLGAVLVAAACSAEPRGRIMDEDEDDFVGAERAGAATYDRLIEEAVGKLLARHRVPAQRVDGMKVAFVDVENATSEELGEWRAQLFELISTSVNSFEGYNMISARFVEAAMREGRLTLDDLFAPAGRRQFASLLERQDSPIDYILFARLTRGSTDGDGGVRQANYALTLEMVDLVSGEFDKETARLRKAYTN